LFVKLTAEPEPRIGCLVDPSTNRLLMDEIAVSTQVPRVVGNRSSAAFVRFPETSATAPIPAARAARNLRIVVPPSKCYRDSVGRRATVNNS